VKIWDVNTLSHLQTYDYHKDKVQSVQWHPLEPTVLLTGAYDKTAQVCDVRAQGANNSWEISSDCECLEWNLHNPRLFLVSTEDGLVTCYDVMMPGKSLWILSGHASPVASLSINPVIPNFFATASVDKSVKLWCIKENKPTMIHKYKEKNALYAVSFYKDSPFLIATGGKESKLKIHNTFDQYAVQQEFADYAQYGKQTTEPADSDEEQ